MGYISTYVARLLLQTDKHALGLREISGQCVPDLDCRKEGCRPGGKAVLLCESRQVHFSHSSSFYSSVKWESHF